LMSVICLQGFILCSLFLKRILWWGSLLNN